MPFILTQGTYDSTGYNGQQGSSLLSEGPNAFTDDKSEKGALVSKLTFGLGPGNIIRCMRIYWNDGTYRYYGSQDSSLLTSSLQTLTLSLGERIQSISVWGSGTNSDPWPGLRRIKITTDQKQTIDVGDANAPATSEQQIGVGSGLLTGVFGKAGDWIDSLGFYFINQITEAKLINVTYPDLNLKAITVTPTSFVLNNVTNNTANEAPGSTITYEEQTGGVSTFSVSSDSSTTAENSISSEQTLGVDVSVEADFLDIASEKLDVSSEHKESSSSSYTVTQSAGSQKSLSVSTQETLTQTYPSPPIPPFTTRTFTLERGEANFDIPFTATLQILCVDNSIGNVGVNGIYRGVAMSGTNMTFEDTKIS